MEIYKTIALTGGGTAGHILPSIALKDELIKHFNKIIYIGSSKGQEVKLCTEHGLPLFCVETIKFERRKILKNFKIPSVLKKGIDEAAKILIDNKVDVVFSKGGYVALPAVLAANRLKIPVVIHESDATLGLANKVTKGKASKVITSFSSTPLGINGVYLGNPIRNSIFKGDSKIVLRRFNISNTKPILLVLGGSLGSVTINNCIAKAVEQLTQRYNVIHITGKNKVAIKCDGYHTIEYADDIQNYHACANIVISRAGASASLEIMALGKKVIFIPLEKSGRGDQLDNAKYYGEYNGVKVLREKELNPDSLLKTLEKLEKCEKNNFIFDKNTNEKIVNEIVMASNNKQK